MNNQDNIEVRGTMQEPIFCPLCQAVAKGSEAYFRHTVFEHKAGLDNNSSVQVFRLLDESRNKGGVV